MVSCCQALTPPFFCSLTALSATNCCAVAASSMLAWNWATVEPWELEEDRGHQLGDLGIRIVVRHLEVPGPG